MSLRRQLACLAAVAALGCSDTGPVPFVFESPAAGTGGSTSGVCSTSYTFDSSDCDTCMRQSCCGTLQQCDTTGPCVDVNSCGTSSCDSATDLLGCMAQSCASYGDGSIASWAGLYTCERAYCASACGTGTGNGSCPSTVEYTNPDCDACARNSCCSNVQSCDEGSTCYSIDQCRQSSCNGYTDDQMFTCVSVNCSGFGYDALQVWNGYWTCLLSSCRGTCTQ
jgi:hypothetical protein